SEVSRHARQIARSLDQLMQASGSDTELGMSLDALGNAEASGKLLIMNAIGYSCAGRFAPRHGHRRIVDSLMGNGLCDGSIHVCFFPGSLGALLGDRF
ncbi:MAG: hypothetical protein EB036_08605, partial [Betaproteobacteria bacterium]|nr:hypothetical protein [Betaproteobacteria bacterium]